MIPLVQRAPSRRAPAFAWAALEQLASADAVVAPLARLHVVALRAEDGASWNASAPVFDPLALERGIPLLHTRSLAVDGSRLAQLLARLAASATHDKVNGAAAIQRALAAHGHAALDLRALAEASITQSPEAFAQTGVDPALLALLMQLAVQPLLRACALQAAPLLNGWTAGYCPLCAAWAALSEVRGLEQQRWLRCGRCAAAWQFELQRCYVCGNQDFQTLGYLAPEAAREARQASTCDVCHSYLKTLTTVSAFTSAELMHKDLATLELDVAALEHGYTRPAGRAFALGVHLEL